MNKLVVQPAGNYYDKYNTRNPIARLLMMRFLASFDELAGCCGKGRSLEIGCGEGELSIRLARAGWVAEGFDIAPDAVCDARERAMAAGVDVSFSVCRVEDAIGRYATADLVVCCEVLEHLEDPQDALRMLEALCTGYLLVSVPREPIWRFLNLLRFRYVRALGNTPGHIQHWSRNEFIRMLAERFEIVAMRSPLPWTMVLCRVRG